MKRIQQLQSSMGSSLRLAVSIGYIILTIVVSADAGSLPTGAEIARRINARDEGQAVSRELTMTMTDRRGKVRKRETISYRKYFGEEKRTVIFYRWPTNVKGTAFLTYDYPEPNRDDDQWLYLPAMRKVRRISASDRGDYFLGTDFTYEDIKIESKVSLEDYRRNTLGKELLEDHHTYVLESIPVNDQVAKELGYSRILAWIDSTIWMARRSQYWDIAGNLLKTLTQRDIKAVQGIWTAHHIEIINHKTGHKTLFQFNNVRYGTNIADNLFTVGALKRGR